MLCTNSLIVHHRNTQQTERSGIMSPCGLVLFFAGLIVLLLAGPSVTGQTSRADSAKSYLERGSGWLKKGEIERAISDFDLAIATDQRLAAAWYNRGLAHYRQGNQAGA